MTTPLQERLFALQDKQYAAFQAKLTPGVPMDSFIGIRQTDAFLPYVDNWAVCDILSPKVFAKHKAELMEKIESYRITPEQKAYLRTLKVKTNKK